MKSFASTALIVAAFTLVVSGCALLKPAGPPPETYDIAAPRDFSTLSGATRAQLLIKEPTALSSLDSKRITVKQGRSVITYLAGAQFGDTVPRLIQARLLEAFENTGRVAAVAKPGDGLVIDFQLVSDLRHFEINSEDQVAEFEISVDLLSDRRGKVLENRIFKASAPVRGSGNDAYVAALEAAFDDAARAIVAWVLNRI